MFRLESAVLLLLWEYRLFNGGVPALGETGGIPALVSSSRPIQVGVLGDERCDFGCFMEV